MRVRSIFVIAGLFVSLYASAARAGCADNAADLATASQVSSLVRAVETKFNLQAGQLSSLCGGSSIRFLYVPPIALVPADSYFADWNLSFDLGSIEGGKDAVTNLQKLLDLPVERIEKLKVAQSLIVRDSQLIEAEYGIDVQIWPVGVNGSKSIVDVSAQFCNERFYMSSKTMTQILTPVSTLQSLLQVPDARMYQSGDMMKALQESSTFKVALDEFSKSNLQTEGYFRRNGHGRTSQCSKNFNGYKDVEIDWNKTRAQFGLPPIHNI